jgi:RNA polymerase sigma-70 factor (ECF subfamily)
MAVARQNVVDDKAISSHESKSDTEIVTLLRAREFSAALHIIIGRYGPPVYRYCVGNLRDLTLAEDTHQQVFVQVFRDLPRLKDAERFRIWLFAIARNRVFDAIRRRRRTDRHAEMADDVELSDPPASAETRVDETRLQSALTAALEQLDDATRAAVLLRYQQGLTFGEISEICGENAGALQARVQRTLPRLRKLIEARLGPL